MYLSGNRKKINLLYKICKKAYYFAIVLMLVFIILVVSEWGVLVLVLSAVVLTVALGLVTCVLNHYRSGAGGTAAVDPHDAAQTPTTAPVSTKKISYVVASVFTGCFTSK